MSELIRVLVADDHPVVRDGLNAVLLPRNGVTVVGEAADGHEAVELARRLKPDVVLMDLMMPQLDGIRATEAIVRENPSVHVLVLTSFGEEQRLADAIRAGASGFLLKDFQRDDLLQAIRTVHGGQLAVPAQMGRRLMTLLNAEEREADALTEREKDVLDGVSRGLSNQAIADELSIGLNTVRSHIHNLLSKLALANRTQLALYASRRPHGAARDR